MALKSPTLPSLDWRSRSKAALIHLSGSLVAALAIGALVFGLWFPWPYRTAAGGTDLFTLVMSVDVVLGPLITFAIFDLRKGWPHLRRDLAVVVTLQLAALAYGAHTVLIVRPVVLALEEDRFRIVSANDVLESELARAPEGLRELSLNGPRPVWARVPTDGDAKFEAIKLGLSGYDIGARPSLWHPWNDEGRRMALANAKPMAALAERYPQRRAELDAAASKAGRTSDALVWLPMIARNGDWVVLLDKASGETVGFAPFDGF